MIQSRKENLEKQISILEKEKNLKNNSKEKQIFNNYIEYIKRINFENKSSSKNFFIIIHQKDDIPKKNSNYNSDSLIKENLNDQFFQVKETLTRCGNYVYELEKKETLNILYSFFNTRKEFLLSNN